MAREGQRGHRRGGDLSSRMARQEGCSRGQKLWKEGGIEKKSVLEKRQDSGSKVFEGFMNKDNEWPLAPVTNADV